MNKKHPIDELFKQHLGQTSADVPEDMWDKIASVRRQVNKKPKLLWFWSSLGIALVFGGILFATNAYNSTKQAEEEKYNEVIEKPVLHAQTEYKASENDVIEEHGSIAELNSNPKNNASINQQSTLALSASSTSEDNSNQTNQRSSTPKSNQQKGAEIDISTTALTEKQESSKVVAIQDASIIPTTERNLSSYQSLKLNTGKNIPLLSQNQDIKLFTKSATSCARFNSPLFQLDLELLAGPAYAQQQLNSRASESNAHLTQRLESESEMLSYSAGLRLGATTNAGLGLKTGLVYSEINDVFEHNIGSRVRLEYQYNTQGEIIGVDTILVEATTQKHKNRLKFLEIPVLVSYETRVGKFRLGINAGAYLQLVFDAKGQIFSPATDEPIEFGQVGDRNVLPIFKQKTSAAWYAGASVTYNLHSRFSIMAEPYFKTFPRALSAPDYDLTQNYWTVGLQLGMRMRL